MNRLQYLIIIILLIFISCKNSTTNAQVDGATGHFDFTSKYTYEDISESDDEPFYNMYDWSKDKKDFYYKKAVEIIFYSMESFDLPNNDTFIRNIEEVFNYKIDQSKSYSILPYSIFETDTLQDLTNQIVIFNNENILAFNRRLPLLTKTRLEYYNSGDFQENNYTYNNVLNTAIFQSNTIDEEYINEETYYPILEYLVFSFHYHKNDLLLKKLIQNINQNPGNYSQRQVLQLFFFRDRYEVDLKFIEKISHIDANGSLRLFFEKALKELNRLSEERKKSILVEIAEIYKSKESSTLNVYKLENLSKEDIIEEYSHDIDGDGFDDHFIVSQYKENSSLCKMRLTILKGNNSEKFQIWYNNPNVLIEIECENAKENFKRIVFKGTYFTIEELSSDRWEIAKYFKTFKFVKEKNSILLSKYGIIIENINGDAPDKEKVFTSKDFGNLPLENIIESDFINLN